MRYYNGEVITIGFGVSIAVFVQGIIFYLITAVLCNIGEDVISIKNKLNKD